MRKSPLASALILSAAVFFAPAQASAKPPQSTKDSHVHTLTDKVMSECWYIMGTSKSSIASSSEGGYKKTGTILTREAEEIRKTPKDVTCECRDIPPDSAYFDPKLECTHTRSDGNGETVIKTSVSVVPRGKNSILRVIEDGAYGLKIHACSTKECAPLIARLREGIKGIFEWMKEENVPKTLKAPKTSSPTGKPSSRHPSEAENTKKPRYVSL